MGRWGIGVAAVALALGIAVSVSAADFTDNFDELSKSWKSVEEPGGIMGDASPGAWKIEKGMLDGASLHQTANTWGDKGDEEPYYTRIGRKPDTYRDKVKQSIRLEVVGSDFAAYIENQKVVTATDATYPSGKIGLVCFAQNDMWFDNLKIIDQSLAVSAAGNLAVELGRLKRGR